MPPIRSLGRLYFTLFISLQVLSVTGVESSASRGGLSSAGADADVSFSDADVFLDEDVSPFVAPKCWKSATKILMELESPSTFLSDWKQEGSGASHLCQSMSEHHQKYLALAIAKCHLSDMGLDLYKLSEYVQQNCQNDQPPQNLDQLYGCLQSLTSHGVDAYTHYVSHVQVLCSRLTHGVWLTYQQESQVAMLHAFRGMAEESTKHTDMLRRTVSDLASQMDELANVPNILSEDISHKMRSFFDDQMNHVTTRMQDVVETHVNDQLNNGMNRLLETLSSQYYAQMEQMADHVSQQEQEQEARLAQWIAEQNRLIDIQKEELVKQQDALTAQRDYIQSMTSEVTEAAEKLKSFSTIEIIVQYARFGYEWIMTLLYTIVALNITWLFTRPSFSRGARPYLVTFVWLQAVFEIYLSLSTNKGTHGEDDLALSAYDGRLLTACASILVYCLTLVCAIVRCLFPCGEADEVNVELPAAHVGTQPTTTSYIHPNLSELSPTTWVVPPRVTSEVQYAATVPPSQVYCHVTPQQVLYHAPHHPLASRRPMGPPTVGPRAFVPPTEMPDDDDDDDESSEHAQDADKTTMENPWEDTGTHTPLSKCFGKKETLPCADTVSPPSVRPHPPPNQRVGLLKKKRKRRSGDAKSDSSTKKRVVETVCV